MKRRKGSLFADILGNSQYYLGLVNSCLCLPLWMREKASENGITTNNALKEQEMMEMIFTKYSIKHSQNIFE